MYFPKITIQECRIDNQWDVDLLVHMVGADKVYSLLQDLGHHNQGEDILIWIENADEKFTTKSTWSCLRIRAPEVDRPKWVWHPSLPKRISVSI